MATGKKNSKAGSAALRKVSKRLDLKVGDRIVFNDGREKVSLTVKTHNRAHYDTSAVDRSGVEAILFDSDFEKGHVFYAPARKTRKK